MNVFSLIKMCFAKAKFDFIFFFLVKKVVSGTDNKRQVAFSPKHDWKNQFMKVKKYKYHTCISVRLPSSHVDNIDILVKNYKYSECIISSDTLHNVIIIG